MKLVINIINTNIMKKLIFILITIFATSALFAQVREKSDYEKYWEAKEVAKFDDTVKVEQTTIKPEYNDLYYNAKLDSIKEQQKSLREEKRDFKKEQQKTVVNNYYYNDFHYANLINKYYRGSFSFWYNYQYSSFYSNSWYWNSNFGLYDPFYYDYYPYYSWNYRPYYYWYSPYYSYWHWKPAPKDRIHNNYNYNGHNIQYSHRERPSTMILNQLTIKKVNIIRNQAETRSSTITQERRTTTTTSQQDKPTYSETRRTYTPSYSTPRMNTRPEYNNSKTRSYNSSGTDRPIYTRPSTQTRTSTSTQTRTYSTPQRSYSAPSRAPSTAPSRSSGSFNSGSSGVSRSSGSSSSSSTGSSRSSSSGRR